jgi:hypothetical protein
MPCQAFGTAVFIVAMACSMTFDILTCRASPTVHGTWANVHPGHRPSRPKLEHSPLLPTIAAKNLIPPCLHSSTRVILGYIRLKAATAFWHKGGVAVLMDGFTPIPACVRVRAGPATGLVWALGSIPRNATAGHVIMHVIEQLSTNCWTVDPSCDHGSASPLFQPLHAKKNWRPSWWTLHMRCRQMGWVIRDSRSVSCSSSPSLMACT